MSPKSERVGDLIAWAVIVFTALYLLAQVVRWMI